MTYAYTTLAHYIQKKKEDGIERKQISTNKTYYELNKISTYLLPNEGGSWEPGLVEWCSFYKKNKIKSEMFNNRKSW